MLRSPLFAEREYIKCYQSCSVCVIKTIQKYEAYFLSKLK